MRPLVLLDVDGVLNVLGEESRATWDVLMAGRATADGTSFSIMWSPEVIQTLNGWIEDGVEVQWLTTWGHDANHSLRHLVGLPELPVAGTYDEHWRGASESTPAASHAEMAPAAPDPLTGEWWKYDVVQRLLRQHPDRLLVWIDDELFLPSPFRRWADWHERVHAIGPDGDLGLTQDDLDEIASMLG